MTERIIIAGAGGQGILLLGRILAYAAMRENKYVTYLPSYGAEVRGGTAHCSVIISDSGINSPYITQADSLVIMNQPSIERFKARLKNKGLFIINSSLTTKEINRNTHPLKYPFTDIAIKLGNIKASNMVALGCYLAQKKIINPKTVLKVIEEITPSEKKCFIEINKKALAKGMELRNGKG